MNMKKIIVISTSLRHGSNSDMLAENFRPIAQFAGWNSPQRSISTGVLTDSNVSRHKLTFENCL